MPPSRATPNRHSLPDANPRSERRPSAAAVAPMHTLHNEGRSRAAATAFGERAAADARIEPAEGSVERGEVLGRERVLLAQLGRVRQDGAVPGLVKEEVGARLESELLVRHFVEVGLLVAEGVVGSIMHDGGGAAQEWRVPRVEHHVLRRSAGLSQFCGAWGRGLVRGCSCSWQRGGEVGAGEAWRIMAVQRRERKEGGAG